MCPTVPSVVVLTLSHELTRTAVVFCVSRCAAQYSTIHRLETNKLRNVAKFFAHLLYADGLDWGVLEYIKLTENDTTSSSRIFLKILFQVFFVLCPR